MYSGIAQYGLLILFLPYPGAASSCVGLAPGYRMAGLQPALCIPSVADHPRGWSANETSVRVHAVVGPCIFIPVRAVRRKAFPRSCREGAGVSLHLTQAPTPLSPGVRGAPRTSAEGPSRHPACPQRLHQATFSPCQPLFHPSTGRLPPPREERFPIHSPCEETNQPIGDHARCYFGFLLQSTGRSAESRA